jgi:predicted small secreted protein
MAKNWRKNVDWQVAGYKATITRLKNEQNEITKFFWGEIETTKALYEKKLKQIVAGYKAGITRRKNQDS